MFKSLPLTIRKIEATEARLNRIYDAAKLGLKGDSLALASGMRPEEFRQLCELDPLALMAVQKGKADGEFEMSSVLHAAAREGDAKAALEILRHQHDWVAKQQVQVDVNQQISILGALREAEQRLEIIDVEDATEARDLASKGIEHANNNLLSTRRTDLDGAAVVRQDQG